VLIRRRRVTWFTDTLVEYIMPVYDELYKFKDELQHVLVRHEQELMLHKDMQEQQEK
jgi:hypothetical protein